MQFFHVLLALVVLALAATAAVETKLRGVSEEVASTKPPKTKLKACWKEGEARGPGVLPDRQSKTCPATHPDKSMGLCYGKCSNDKREGFGPLCWDNCSKTIYKANGIIFCCDTDDICSHLVTDMAVKIPEALAKFAIDISVNPANVLKLLRDFRELVSDVLALDLPLCDKMKPQEADAVVDESAVLVADM